MRHSKRKNVLLLMEWYDHPIREGLGRFAAEHHWILTVNDGCTLPDGWHGDGILTYFDTRRDIINYVQAATVPVVSLSGFRPDIKLPTVTGDHVGMGTMAADFFHAKGFTRAAYFATQLHRLQKLRLHGFAKRWKELSGNRVIPMVPAMDNLKSPADDWTALRSYITGKILAIPKPLAVFAYCDYDAAKVEAAVLEAGLRVPEDVAILGVDNDPLVCENDEVPISSICHDRNRIGYEGAAMLEQLMSRRKVANLDRRILPYAIKERASTHGVYTDDKIAQQVIAYFSDHLASKVGLTEAAAHVGMNPRVLERHFSEHVGRTATSYLRELRLLRAQQLVQDTDDPFGDIASRCGFANAQHFSNAFRAAFGTTPSQARTR